MDESRQARGTRALFTRMCSTTGTHLRAGWRRRHMSHAMRAIPLTPAASIHAESNE